MSEPPVVTNLAVAAGADALHKRYCLLVRCPHQRPVEDARVVLEAGAAEIIAAARQLLVAETADEVTAVTQATVLEAVAASTARIAELEAALTDALARFVTTSSGRTARVSGTVLARWQAIADGQDGGGDGG